MLSDQRLLPGEAGVADGSIGFALWLAHARNLLIVWGKHRRRRLPKELAGLSDNMLLDIGIDPRWVPNPAGDLIPRPDLNQSGLVTPIWRATAKS